MFKKLISRIIGDPNRKILSEMRGTVDRVAAEEKRLLGLTDEQLREESAELRSQVEAGASLDDVLPQVFAIVREASRRTTGMRHFDVQIMGGILMHQGNVVEMRTGEGKTLVATLPLTLNALTGRGVHLVTVNDYLARRDGGWMGKIYHALGLSVACIGPQDFSALYDPTYVNPGAELEDDRLVHWRPCTRQEAYAADITYGISSEFGFDYLRDNMAQDRSQLVQREQYYAIIDEVDNILIDEARTPLIISGQAGRSSSDYLRFAGYARNLKENTAPEGEEPNAHYDIDHKSRSITLTELGIAEIEKRLPEIDVEAGDNLYDPRFYHLTYYLDNAIRAEYLFKRDQHYIVSNGEVIIVDDFTGRPMPGRRYSDGLHEAIEAKEGVDVRRETVTVATITLQNYFRMYEKMAGMTGTAMTDAEEFDKIYTLGVFPLPTNVEYIVSTGAMGLQERVRKEDGVETVYYVKPGEDEPVFFRRADYKDQIYKSETAKDQAIVEEIRRVHAVGRPILVGTTSVEHSERIAKLLKRDRVNYNVLNAKMHQSEALVVAQAGRRGAITISTNMAGRGTDILLGGNSEGLAAEKLEHELFDRPLLSQLAKSLLVDGETAAHEMATKHPKLSLDLVTALQALRAEFEKAQADIELYQLAGFVARHLQTVEKVDFNHALEILPLVLTGAIPLARARAKELGHDTAIVEEATRLLDLHGRYSVARQNDLHAANFLGEILFERLYNGRAALIRAVIGGKVEEAQQLVNSVPGLSPAHVRRIQEIQKQAAEEKQEVWRLGGLHVVGSERHESRRIDNQLRGRAARQGDPGSSRFFLSLEDDLLRRFGGERLNSLMERFSFPEDMPIENSVLDRLIESSQERLEGYNFDTRKNLVEYDDVMNKQRTAIYNERREILLSESVDLDAKITSALETAVEELVHNYRDNYAGYVRQEIERAIGDYSTDATGQMNVRGVLGRVRTLLPAAPQLRDELVGVNADKLTARLMQLAQENLEKGTNLYQLLQAMGRFLPLMPTVPNVAAILSGRRTNQVQVREAIRQEFLHQVEQLYNDFLADHIAPADRARIWEKTAVTAINEAFLRYPVERATLEGLHDYQPRFKGQVDDALTNLLVDSLASLSSEDLIEAIKGYAHKQGEIRRRQIGDAEYRNFQRLLLISAIDREWREYLTAIDDLRREIGLAAIAQRDPKVEYKRRSFEMFQNMRRNIDEDVANRFFVDVEKHQDFIRQQASQAAAQVQLNRGGAARAERPAGKSGEARGGMPKVGRNDPCPCGSGKKYKHCHGQQTSPVSVGGGAGNRPNPRPSSAPKRR